MTENLTNVLLRCILNNLIQIENAEDEFIDPDFSIEIMESTAHILQCLNDQEVDKLKKILDDFSNKKEYLENKDYLLSFLEDFGLIKPVG